jgi:hypothetical protein
MKYLSLLVITFAAFTFAPSAHAQVCTPACTTGYSCTDLGLGPQCYPSSTFGNNPPTTFQCNPSANPTGCATGYSCTATGGSTTVGTCTLSSNTNGGATCNPSANPTGCATGYTCTATGGSTTVGTCTLPSNTNGGSAGGTSLTNPLSAGTSLPALLTELLGFVTQIGAVIIVLMMVYVGFLFVTAQGVPAKLQTARQALLYTVIGALILLGAQAIASAIQATATAL